MSHNPPLDLAAIKARESAATPGPWTLGKRTGGYIAPGDYDRLVYPGEHGAPVCSLERPGARHRDDADAEFIAHARVDVPALVREVEGLRKENEALKAEQNRRAGVIAQNARAAAGLLIEQHDLIDFFADVLRHHWLTAVECDHEARTDTARCYCSTWTGTPQSSVGEAVEEWIEHVMASSHLGSAPHD